MGHGPEEWGLKLEIKELLGMCRLLEGLAAFLVEEEDFHLPHLDEFYARKDAESLALDASSHSSVGKLFFLLSFRCF